MLVVDDDEPLGKVLSSLLTQAGWSAAHVVSGEAAIEAVARESFDAVLTDLRMPGMDGLALLRELKSHAPEIPVVMLTAHGTVARAVEAMKAGAADFLTKPFDRDEVVYTIDKALQRSARAAAAPPEPSRDPAASLGASEPMRTVNDRIRRAAASSATVLLLGESGTGKEVAARAIHAASARRDGPFVAVHGAALPEHLLESELFGYERGAFTGAANRKPGRVELASGGTLFLDEIGDVSASVQVKLLRLVQEKEYQLLGATRPEKADVRFVAATHRDLAAMVDEGSFREDLYYRLNVLPIHMPPLRERREDIADLARGFVTGPQRLSDAALARLTAHDWPGNVRELINVIERLVVFSDGEVIDATDVDRELDRPLPLSAPSSLRAAAVSREGDSEDSLAARRHEAERKAVLEALERAGGNRTKAARLLGISRRTLYKRLDEFGL